jgi:hypothetical protein
MKMYQKRTQMSRRRGSGATSDYESKLMGKRPRGSGSVSDREAKLMKRKPRPLASKGSSAPRRRMNVATGAYSDQELKFFK